MAETFYSRQPDYCFWRRSLDIPDLGHYDPVVEFPFSISRSQKVATAGSCFAQHISRHLRNSNFSYLITENGHPSISASTRRYLQYGTYSARYGNIYTARQLLQLFLRAFGEFTPEQEYWPHPKGGVCDPLRPNIEPKGFVSIDELVFDQNAHLDAVRQLFTSLDVFVFTLGLTEAWVRTSDSCILPVPKGIMTGERDTKHSCFVNFSAFDIIEDLKTFLDLLAKVNPSARVILTVSPVPLIATGENRHVWVSTTASKSALRVAAEEISKTHDHVAYFPAYEIVTSINSRGSYFSEDCRSVSKQGVAHVMSLFDKHVLTHTKDVSLPGTHSSTEAESFAQARRELEIICEEDLFDTGDMPSPDGSV